MMIEGHGIYYFELEIEDTPCDFFLFFFNFWGLEFGGDLGSLRGCVTHTHTKIYTAVHPSSESKREGTCNFHITHEVFTLRS